MGKLMDRIDRRVLIEDLLEHVPGVVSYLIDKGLPCLVCGEPSWGTLEEMAKEEGRSEEEIDRLVDDMNAVLLKRNTG